MLQLLALAAAVHIAVPAEARAPMSIEAPLGEVRASQIARVPAEKDTVLAKIPNGVNEVEWTEERREALLRNRYPGQRHPLLQAGLLRIVRQQPAKADVGNQCSITGLPVSSGAYLAETDLVSSPCRDEKSRGWVAYDTRARAFRALQDIPAGIYVGRLRVTPRPAVLAGDEVTYRTEDGPVEVERTVVALQPGRVGRDVFTRTSDGKVLTAPLAEEKVR